MTEFNVEEVTVQYLESSLFWTKSAALGTYEMFNITYSTNLDMCDLNKE